MAKPTKAAALAYDREYSNAPKVVAKGSHNIADKILELAKKHDISIFKNDALVDSLMNLDINEEIPPRLYQAVAELFSWLIQLEKYKK